MAPEQSFSLSIHAMNRAFRRFAHLIAAVCLAGSFLIVLAYQLSDPGLVLWPAAVPHVITIILLLVLDRRPSRVAAAAYLGVGAAGLYLSSVILMQRLPAVSSTDAYVLDLVVVALTLVAGSGQQARRTVLWTLGGYLGGTAATLLAALHSGVRQELDRGTLLVVVGVVAVVLTAAITRPRRAHAAPQLDRAAIDERVSELRYRIEFKAAALMHDTVLNHLAAVAHSDTGELSPRLRRAIERDLEVLIGEEWLADPSPEVDARARADWRNSSLYAAVGEARSRSLTIDLSGDLAAVGRLDRERDAAVGLAVAQCLVNVEKHAGVDRVELVVVGSAEEVSVMVIDSGRGFVVEGVAADRLGLRQSVRGRIEAVGGDVHVWSTPGRGTSVVIRVPAGSGLPGEADGGGHD
ncbi:sensor histidine kinase [Galbitalea soli]|uniref:ATP-binding protein n=1 Tax=Galbitalea soli TaxID=1268042 RepID=A0A7C9TRG3_9MICO|nr:ATP-binding protein [Galbitalea soli]NEM92177.1 ATP-binding protein [Galbitalea soli]NYJ31869.1 signal transduction histidine kinase [Galbitalea soli]